MKVLTKMNSVVFIVLLWWTADFVLSQTIINPGPVQWSTKGEIWPAPYVQQKHPEKFIYDPEKFTFIDHSNCEVIAKAIQRYSALLNNLHALVKQPAKALRREILYFNKNKNRTHTHKYTYLRTSNHFRFDKNTRINKYDLALKYALRSTKAVPDGEDGGGNNLDSLQIMIKEHENASNPDKEVYPHMNMSEMYVLVIDQKSLLSSDSRWGILRGLESFSQSFYLSDDRSAVYINKSVIEDKPAYKHRGLMLDTARHFISVENIQKVLEAMEYNKLNVFHWHLTDDESFPFQSVSHKDFSEKGAYSAKAQYSHEDIKTIVDFARDRGIRVIPELDMPSHTRSWGVADPSLLTMCYDEEFPIGLGPLNPTLDKTYQVISSLIEEMKSLFPDKSFNLGMNDIDFDCWLKNPDIAAYMKGKSLEDGHELLNVFLSIVQEMLPNSSNIIIAAEAANSKVFLKQGTYLQVYDEPIATNTTCQGCSYIHSACWKMDTISVSTASWEEFYSCDISEHLKDKHVLGGEAIMRTFFIDDRNVISRIWPLASATAENLWTKPKTDFCSDPPFQRMEEHACRMLRRGIAVQPPNGPGYCPM